MAKLLHAGTISVYSAVSSHTTDSLKEKYWENAIRGGNPTAIANYGNKLLRDIENSHTFDPNSKITQYSEELLTVAASLELMRGNYGLGRFYEYAEQYLSRPIKTRSGILKIYRHAAWLDKDADGVGGDLYYRIATLMLDQNEKKTQLQKALLSGKMDAAYQLALIQVEKYEEEEKRESLLSARQLLVDYLPYFSNDVKKAANFLLQSINKRLDS